MTIRNEEGKCVQITECKTLADILGKPISKENISYLTKSGCGFENQIPKICCPVETFQTTTKSEEASEAREETTTDIPETTIKISDEFDFNSRDGRLNYFLFLFYNSCFQALDQNGRITT